MGAYQSAKQFFNHYWPLGLTILIALLLRWPYRDGGSLYLHSEFLRDRAMMQAMNSGHWPLLGPDSHLGHFNFGPIYYYLLFPFAKLFNFAPYGQPAASVFFSLATIVLLFFVVKKWWRNEYLAYLTAIILALSHFDAIFAKYSSNPNFLPFFCLLFFYALQKLIINEDVKVSAFLLALAFGVATQLHVVALISLSLILVIELILKKIRITTAVAAIFISTVLALYLPYIYYQFTHNFADVRGLIFLARTSSSFQEPLQLRLVEYFGFWFGPWVSSQIDFDVFYVLGNAMIYFIAAACLGLWLTFKLNQNHLHPVNIDLNTPPSVKHMLWVWFLAPTIILLLPISTVTSLLVFYFFTLAPLLYIVYALAVVKLLQKGWRLVVYYLALVFLLLQILQFWLYDALVKGRIL